MNNIGLKFVHHMLQARIHARIGPAPFSKMPDGNAALIKHRFEASREGLV
jgi:hypothetical protein